MRRSLQEYVGATLKYWWSVAVSFVIDLLGFGGTAAVKPVFNVPLWVWVAIVVIGLFVAQFLAFHSVRTQRETMRQERDTLKKRKELREALGRFLAEGQALRRACADESKPPPNGEANDWAARTEEILRISLGNSYVARFRSDAGLPMVGNSIFSIPHRNLWSGIHTRLARLEQFLGELGDTVHEFSAVQQQGGNSSS